MNPEQRSKRHWQITVIAGVAACALLCFAVLLSPKLRKMARVNEELGSTSKQLADMRKEIEDARIAGPVAEGESRFEKFGILGFDEEQLFLSDLIDFCTETANTLELVRRSDVPRPVRTQEEQQGATRGSRTAKPAASSDQPPGPIIQRVLHTVSYSGSFLSSFQLLQRLESYKRLLTVERMEVATDARVGYLRVNGNITIDLYLVRDPGGALSPRRASSEGAGASSAPGAAPQVVEQESEDEAQQAR